MPLVFWISATSFRVMRKSLMQEYRLWSKQFRHSLTVPTVIFKVFSSFKNTLLSFKSS